MPLASSDACNSFAGALVELAFHQPRHHVHYRDVHAAQLEAVRCLEAEQTTADDDSLLVTPGSVIIASVSAMSR